MRAWSAALLTLTFVVGCPKREVDAPPDAQAEAANDEEITPVYPTAAGKVPARVRRLCRALHELPKTRRAACCDRRPGILLTEECERNLAGALTTGGVTLAEEAVARCEAAIARQHEGCDWVAPTPLPTPEACLDILVGTRTPGQGCRSSLECPPGLTCHGLSPTDLGRCGPSAPAGVLCNTGADPLASYARQDHVERTRPVCAGYCDRHRCRDAIPVGQACVSNVQCGPGHRCLEGKCAKGAEAADGEPCLGGDCAKGLVCAAKRCAAPKALGETCTTDAECRAVCTDGKCATTCDTAPILRELSKPMRAPPPAP